MISSSVDLLVNASATGATVLWPGGRGAFTAAGTFGGATVSLDFLGPDGATWIAMGPETTLTAAGGALFDFPQSPIRASVTGGTPSGLYAHAARVAA
jgi:hypothetical protein